MRRSIFSVLVVLSGLSAPALVLAQTCPIGQGQDLSLEQITSLLSGRYVYGTQYDGQYFNLHHAGGTITDYKRGPNDPMDKSAPVGNYLVERVGNRDVVTYRYGTSYSYSYSISPKPTGQNSPAPGTYVMCQRAGTSPNNVGQAINVTVSDSPGPVQP